MQVVGLTPRAHDDDGFTLIELMVTLVILPLVIGGLTMMLLMVLQNQSGVSNKLTGSSDATVTSAIFSQDVQSADEITTQSSPECNTTGTEVLALRSSVTGAISSYVLVANGSVEDLFREVCASPGSTPYGQTLMSANAPSTLAASVSCATSCTPATAWVYSARVSEIGLSVAETSTGVSYAVTAVPRLWSAASVGLTAQEDMFPIPPLDILATGTCANQSINVSGGSTITIANGGGDIQNNTTCANGMVFSSGTITAAAIETANTKPSTAYTISGSASIPPVVYAAAVPDPFASLSPPTNPTASGAGACTLTGTTGSCTPGSYSGAIDFQTGSWTLQPGTYVFKQGVTVSKGVPVTFEGGTYLFDQGLNISDAPVTFDSGTYIFEGQTSSSAALNISGSGSIKSGPGGSLLYIESGTTTLSGSGSVALSGLAQYDGISIWQAATDTNKVTLSGSSGVSDAYGGVYVPDAEVVPSGSATATVSFLVAGSVNYSGGASLNAG